MSPVIRVKVGPEPFDPAAETAILERSTANVGAVCTFTGLVRVTGDQAGVRGLKVEHYPGMTERAIEALCQKAAQRWGITAISVIHRVGALAVGERIVFVGTGSEHRSDAFSACEYLMDHLKTEAPFWKKEWTAHDSRWVVQKQQDIARARRWDA
ncbi:molybdenum cofactor biosynthesis protein MoaE [Hydrocarboniclastica marina]|uniref:Molybdopterin synthase catalytic subunit n=1 Tax=Hydrocarboniclastica marina TaxID=2259620 RepID=A0A4P7XKF9_9ALTE|nr:molybdenum cofactor biosynthesis protein MoaE [Hydrocarboniclastica marina]MAL97230.1 molybdenum cofactor biosynthesis protein MoaE [Alteromonadaceae bacterium]QCF27375.1 molybdenum cofactor biosynthesis protein MoaE [Hydrocarboniclastica marina]|tara:strand:+ start:6472 stop:6936 length:465 start_codon:yes stop_codon:yes gene_type:complete